MILEAIHNIDKFQQVEIKPSTPIFIENQPEVAQSAFINLIQHLDSNIKTSDSAMQSYILNQGISTHELMIAMENAKHSLQLSVEIRNRIVEAYEKITQMSI